MWLTKACVLRFALHCMQVRFAFRAATLGMATLEFHVEDGEGASDTLQVLLPSHAPQPPVRLATSFAVRAGPNHTTAVTGEVEHALPPQQQRVLSPRDREGGGPPALAQQQGHAEGLQLPHAVPGSGALDLWAGLGYLPPILAFFESAAQAAARLCTRERTCVCAMHVFVRVFAYASKHVFVCVSINACVICVCVRLCVCVQTGVCMCVCLGVCVQTCVCVFLNACRECVCVCAFAC